ncbi:MAG: DUF5916 domain-containing protein, partial [Longimicrobiales bacterium]
MRIVILTVLLAILPVAVFAQDADSLAADGAWPVDPETVPRPEAFATRIDRPIRIDGLLDEAVWQLAAPLGTFVQSQPDAGYPATEPTVVRIMYDDHNLYIGAIAYDSEPDHLVVASLERDFPGGSTRDADIFSFTLDTFLDRRNCFIYLINPYGAYRDGQVFNDSRNTDFGWDGVMEVKTRIHEDGWTVELAIPWTSLRFNPTDGEQAWGINLLRRVRRKNEDSYWAPVDRRDPVHRMSKAGTLRGLTGLDGGRNLSVKPYVLGATGEGSLLRSADRAPHGEIGGDAKWGITPGLTLDLTLNTDFSQVEVDEEQINLTRFPLFFPEQRDFFVENSGSFTFGDVIERNYRMGTSLRDFTLFHSRRIGLRDGRPVPIIGGARLTGRAGGWELGVLDIQTDETGAAPAENFAVLRARREIAGSDVGAMFINRAATDGSGDYNRSYGIDANLRLLGAMIVNSYVAHTDARGAGGDANAARLSVAYRDRDWDVSAQLRHIGDAFDPGVGFVRRRAIREGYATIGIHRRPAIPFVQEVAPYIEYDYVTDLDGALTTRDASAGISIDFLDGGVFSTSHTRRHERLTEPFDVAPAVTIPAGAYSFGETTASYQSDAGRKLSGAIRLTAGGFYGGTRRSLGFDAFWQPNHHVGIDLSADYNAVDVTSPLIPDGEFQSNVYG